jgi:hypothetical protein
MSAKSSTQRSRTYRERVKRGETIPGRRARNKPIPDALVVPFPSNFRADDSAGAHLATWGPNHDILPLHPSNIVIVEKGKLICTCSLHFVLQGIGFYLYDCKLVKWGQGERVMLPERQVRPGTFRDLILFDRNATARSVEESALSAIRHALAEFRQRQVQAAPATEAAEPVDEGVARGDDDDIPF